MFNNTFCVSSQIQYVQQMFSLNSLQLRLEFFVTILNITDREPIQGLHETLTESIRYLRQAVPKAGFFNTPPDNKEDDEEFDIDEVSMSVSEDKDDSDVVHEDADGVRRTGQRRTKRGKRKGPYDRSRARKRDGGPKDDDSGGATGAGGRRSGGGDEGEGGQSVTPGTSAQKTSEHNEGISTRSQTKGKKWVVQDLLIRAGYITATGVMFIFPIAA